ncbi:Protein of uncharacterised function (DUF3168) [Klebsiella michiganensis]|uniref:Protein of uncharacterized function (DUF3168) n=1 Tax=Klebsiella michiganensis TaxID=1134687 RepID=A0A7H4MW75_9ENTR|nr:Protein of uncharacterised function (DUF3168) [Klebsiella michiganensis]
MIAPIFSVCAASQAVKDLLGTNPVRLYPFGIQDDNIVYPYAVWQNIGGSPENYLNQRLMPITTLSRLMFTVIPQLTLTPWPAHCVMQLRGKPISAVGESKAVMIPR